MPRCARRALPPFVHAADWPSPRALLAPPPLPQTRCPRGTWTHSRARALSRCCWGRSSPWSPLRRAAGACVSCGCGVARVSPRRLRLAGRLPASAAQRCANPAPHTLPAPRATQAAAPLALLSRLVLANHGGAAFLNQFVTASGASGGAPCFIVFDKDRRSRVPAAATATVLACARVPRTPGSRPTRLAPPHTRTSAVRGDAPRRDGQAAAGGQPGAGAGGRAGHRVAPRARRERGCVGRTRCSRATAARARALPALACTAQRDAWVHAAGPAALCGLP